MIDGWGSASVVCIGYSWWWGIAAWLVNSFVKSNEFAQKTLYFEANLILIDRKRYWNRDMAVSDNLWK